MPIVRSAWRSPNSFSETTELICATKLNMHAAKMNGPSTYDDDSSGREAEEVERSGQVEAGGGRTMAQKSLAEKRRGSACLTWPMTDTVAMVGCANCLSPTVQDSVLARGARAGTCRGEVKDTGRQGRATVKDLGRSRQI